MTTQVEVSNDERYKPYLDHGFVGYIEKMGSDFSIDEAARMSYGQGTRPVSDTRNLIRYLIRHFHTSPIEMAEVKFHLKLPIFIMRQLVRHRTASLNEYSGRYSEMVDEFYVPSLERFQEQSKSNKQGSGDSLHSIVANNMMGDMQALNAEAYQEYLILLEEGLSRELARIVLPVSNYTELYWKCDLNNFFKFLRLRLDPHAQKEIRDLAQLMYDAVKVDFPICSEAFEDYWLQSKTFSRMELGILKQCIDVDKLVKLSFSSSDLSKREKEEFQSYWDK